MSRNRKVSKQIYIPNQELNTNNYWLDMENRSKFEKLQEKLKYKRI